LVVIWNDIWVVICVFIWSFFTLGVVSLVGIWSCSQLVLSSSCHLGCHLCCHLVCYLGCHLGCILVLPPEMTRSPIFLLIENLIHSNQRSNLQTSNMNMSLYQSLNVLWMRKYENWLANISNAE
jgi:hypothetical protein